WALFTSTIWSSMFFARADFLRRRWLLGPFVRSTLPEPVTLKRLAVALCVLILYFLPTVCLPCSNKSFVHSHQKVGRLRHPTTTRPSFWSIADCWACQGGGGKFTRLPSPGQGPSAWSGLPSPGAVRQVLRRPAH